MPSKSTAQACRSAGREPCRSIFEWTGDADQMNFVEGGRLIAKSMTSDAILGISQQGVLGYLKADAALPALMNAAGHADATVRRAAMSALVFTHAGGPGTSALFAGLRDSHWQVREEAAASIGEVKLAEATEALIAALDDETWHVRAKVAAELGRI